MDTVKTTRTREQEEKTERVKQLKSGYFQPVDAAMMDAAPAQTATTLLGLDDVRFTVVVRAILFYDELCTDLSAFILCEDVYPYLTRVSECVHARL